MSERGSFVTQYVYCHECFKALREVLLKRDKFLCSSEIPAYWDGNLPIIAGKIGGTAAGDELLTFEFDIADMLKGKLCHDVCVAVIPECGEPAFITFKAGAVS